MDPVTAVGLASAIISFIPLGIKVLQNAYEIKSSLDGSVKQNETREQIVKEMQAVAARLKIRVDESRLKPKQMELYNLASRCSDLAKQIFDLLDRIKPKGSTTSAKYYSAFRVWCKESEIKELEKSLESCRGQLILGLADLSSQEFSAYSERILTLVQSESDQLTELQNHMNDIKKAVEHVESQVNRDLHLQLTQLIDLNQRALSNIYQYRILESLKFDAMHQRDDRVHDPYAQTFEWIFQGCGTSHAHTGNRSSKGTYENPDTGGFPGHSQDDSDMYGKDKKEYDPPKRAESRQKFLNWLSLSGDIFHITGKIGSGKSTLMKFLYSHPCTRTTLEQWADGKDLILACFFFWNPGMDLQKSINGLYRSLLYDILESCPILTPDALPSVWHQAKNYPWQGQGTLDIPAKTIKAGLEKLLTELSLRSRLFESHRFCFFIDGLDEHEEVSYEDHVYLVTLLQNWIRTSNGSLKICVSSRDYNTFLNRFSEDKRLNLPDLTWLDMKRYVRESLSHLRHRRLLERFTTEIPLKADGIFLWTILVTAAVRRQIENEASDEKLFKIVNTLPSGLETAFRYTLDGLDEQDRRKTYQIMKLLILTKDETLSRFTLAKFILLDYYNDDKEFSIRKGFPSTSLAAKWAQSRGEAQSYAKRLRGDCAGLIECVQEPQILRTVLDFTHRSIPDMLQSRALQPEINDILGSFNALDAFSHLSLAEAKLSYGGGVLASCASIASARLKNHIDKPPYRFLEAMDSWAGFSIEPPSAGRSAWLYLDETQTVPLGQIDSKGYRPMYTVFSILYLAMVHGDFDFVKWKVEHFPSTLDSPFKKNLFLNCLIGPPHSDRVSSQDLDYFLENEHLTEHCDNSSSFDWIWELQQITEEDRTPWQTYLSSNFLLWCGLKHFVPSLDCDGDRFSHIVTKFLEHGVSADFVVTTNNHPMLRDKIVFHFKNIQTVEFIPDHIRKCTIKNEAVWLEPGGQKKVTFRQWIEAMDLKDKSYILHLLDNADDARVA